NKEIDHDGDSTKWHHDLYAPGQSRFPPEDEDIGGDDDCASNPDRRAWPVIPDEPAENGRPDNAAIVEDRDDIGWSIAIGDGVEHLRNCAAYADREQQRNVFQRRP